MKPGVVTGGSEVLNEEVVEVVEEAVDVRVDDELLVVLVLLTELLVVVGLRREEMIPIGLNPPPWAGQSIDCVCTKRAYELESEGSSR